MLPVVKWIGIVLGGLLAVVLLAVVAIYFIGGSRLNRTYDIQPSAVAVPLGDPAAIQRGKHVAEAFGLCTECHGTNLAGKVLEDDPVFGIVAPAKLTSGKGGVRAGSDANFVRAIRHGVRADGTAIPIMPSRHYNRLSDADTGALIAYIRRVPPVDNELPNSDLQVLGRVLLVAGQLGGFFEVEEIDHDAPRPPEPGVTLEYGKYLATICTACHAADLQGGPLPGDSGFIAPGITSRGGPGRWSEEQFMGTLRTGATPEGAKLDNEFMPWQAVGKMTDDELKAIYLYLKSLPAT